VASARRPAKRFTGNLRDINVSASKAKVSHGQAAPKMEERRVRTDVDTAGAQVAQLR
jgi:hypothetical protein